MVSEFAAWELDSTILLVYSDVDRITYWSAAEMHCGFAYKYIDMDITQCATGLTESFPRVLTVVLHLHNSVT